MLARVWSAMTRGIEGLPVEVHVFVGGTFPMFIVMGAGNEKETKARVLAALDAEGFEHVPTTSKRVTVFVGSADVRKDPAAYDLPIAIGILAAEEQVALPNLEQCAIVGELSLDGRVLPIRGVLPMAEAARAKGMRWIMVPHGNSREAACAEGIEVIPVRCLRDAVAWLNGQAGTDELGPPFPVAREEASASGPAATEPDFADLAGHEQAKRAMLIAAAGRHNVLLTGFAGAGASRFARRLPSILPPMSEEEALSITRMASVAGLLPVGTSLLGTRPFRAPHHTVSETGLLGGGVFPRPGEVSLAHEGVLFLDELPEFGRVAQMALARAVHHGSVTFGLTESGPRFPAAPKVIVGSMYPCPCGNFGSPHAPCNCTKEQIERWRQRVVPEMVALFSLYVNLRPISLARAAMAGPHHPSSASMREDVARVREIQNGRDQRMPRPSILEPASLGSEYLLDAEGKRLFEQAAERLGLSTLDCRAVRLVARTIADMDGDDCVRAQHVAEAITYRNPHP